MHNYLGRAKPRLQEATEIGPPLLPLPECRMCRVRAASFLCLPVSLGSRAFPSSLPGTGGHCAELDEPGAYYWVRLITEQTAY